MGRVRVTSASHSRFFWGLRLHLVCTVHGLPVGWALTGAKADERETLLAVLATMDQPAQDGQVVIADKNYYGAAFEAELAKDGIALIRPRRKGELFNRTLAREWAYAHTYTSQTQREAAYQTWLHHYNHHRPYTALDGQTPASRVHNLSGKYN